MYLQYIFQPIRIRALAAAIVCSSTALAEPSRSDSSDMQPIPVTTAKIGDVVFFPTRTAPATVVTLNNARVSSEISGILQDIFVKVGEEVGEGEVVARIDCRDARVGLSQAEAAHAASQAKNSYDQSRLSAARKLSAKKNISSEEIDKRKADALISAAKVDTAEADLEKASLAVSRCEIRAPFNAVVVERLASVGDYVSPGTAVLKLLDKDSTEVSARIQEIDLESIREADRYFFDGQGNSYPVELRTIVPIMQSRLRSYETRFTFGKKKTSPGSAGRLRWVSPQPHIPAELLVRRKGLGVFVARDNRATFIELPGAQEGKPAASVPGIQDDIIVEGRFNLADGDPIEMTGN